MKSIKPGRKRTALMESVMSTRKDIKPSTNDLEDNCQLEFVKRWRKLAQKINEIREKYPPIYKGKVEVFPEWSSYDGDPMKPYTVERWDYPAESYIDELLKQEYKALNKDLLDITSYEGPDLCDLEGVVAYMQRHGLLCGRGLTCE